MFSLAWLTFVGDLYHLVASLFVRQAALRAENAFLRKQLAMFVERGMRPRRASRSERLWLVLLGKLFDWRGALIVVTPRTFVAWQRDVVRMLWRWKSRRLGRPPLPLDARKLIVQLADENQPSVRRVARSLERDLQQAVERELKWIVIRDSYRVSDDGAHELPQVDPQILKS